MACVNRFLNTTSLSSHATHTTSNSNIYLSFDDFNLTMPFIGQQSMRDETNNLIGLTILILDRTGTENDTQNSEYLHSEHVFLGTGPLQLVHDQWCSGWETCLQVCTILPLPVTHGPWDSHALTNFTQKNYALSVSKFLFFLVVYTVLQYNECPAVSMVYTGH